MIKINYFFDCLLTMQETKIYIQRLILTHKQIFKNHIDLKLKNIAQLKEMKQGICKAFEKPVT